LKKVSAKLIETLHQKAEYYENNWFIEHEPISIPHRFTKPQHIEISAFLSAVIAWGQRKTIINNANKMMHLMDEAPHDFIVNHQPKDLKRFEKFVHRTFNATDLLYFIYALNKIYTQHASLESAFEQGSTACEKITHFKSYFVQWEHLTRTEKHLPNPEKNSSAKRINMFLRWMCRSADKGVDFGIWNVLSPSELMLPLDVHTGNVARSLGLLKRKQNDKKAVEEITEALKKIDAQDPIKFDFALFGIGAFENSKNTLK